MQCWIDAMVDRSLYQLTAGTYYAAISEHYVEKWKPQFFTRTNAPQIDSEVAQIRNICDQNHRKFQALTGQLTKCDFQF